MPIGLRNSFDFTFDPVVPGRIFASENGPGCDDEMNRIEAGNNYGWRPDYPCDDNAEAGPDPTYNTINPLWYIRSADCCVAPTGIAVYTGNQIPHGTITSSWPSTTLASSITSRPTPTAPWSLRLPQSTA